MPLNSRIQTYFSLFLSLVNLFALGVLYWVCDKGLDLSDESYYLMGYFFHDNDPNLYPASFHLVFHRFFSAFQFTIIEIRFLRLGLTILAALVLFGGVIRVLKIKGLSEKTILFNVVLSGMLLSYSWAPLSLSYNSMSSILIAYIVAVWLFATTSKTLFYKTLFSVALGGLFSILFFVKITNVLLLPLLIVMSVYLLCSKGLIRSLQSKYLLVYILAFMLAAFMTMGYIGDGWSLAQVYQTVLNHIQSSFNFLENDATHSTGYLLTRYYKNAKMVVLSLKYPVLLLTLSFVLIQWFWRKSKTPSHLKSSTVFKFIGLLLLVIISIQNRYWMGGAKVVYTMATIYIYMGIFSFLNCYLEKKKVSPIVVLSLIFIPLVGAVGTNNGLSGQVLFYGVFIFSCLFYIISVSDNSFYKSVMLFVLICFGTSQTVLAIILHPYRQSIPAEAQHTITEVDELQFLKTDKTLHQLREELKFLEKNRAKYIFTYSAQGGMTLLADKKPYSLEWFNESATGKMCHIISKSRIEPTDIIFLIPSLAPLREEVLSCLEKKDIFFEKDFSQIKGINYYDQYYKKEITLNVYVPNTNTY